MQQLSNITRRWLLSICLARLLLFEAFFGGSSLQFVFAVKVTIVVGFEGVLDEALLRFATISFSRCL